MGKRSSFKRIEKDFYRTIDQRAVQALNPHLMPNTRYIEACVGYGDLANSLYDLGHICCSFADISMGKDALDLTPSDYPIITNPPWSRPTLHKMIEHFVNISPYCWLLFDADWAHTKQSVPYMRWCSNIVSIGRLIWIPGTKTSGKDNCAWYRFSKDAEFTKFHGRA